jgi:hypothetical protein
VSCRRLVVLLAVGACARGGLAQGDQPDAATVHGDAPKVIDGPEQEPHIDAPAGGAVAALLLTEVVLAPSTGEFIEIANPGNEPVDLSSYYLADGGSYFRLPGGVPAVDATDFIARFPAAATIAPGAVITVALDTAANFTLAYPGVTPTYSLAGGTMTTVVASGVPSLTNAGEVVILFQWDGQADLVHDVDLVLAGVPTAANALVNKNGVAVDGPDADATASTYATDARTLAVQASAPAAGKSTKRIALEIGHETQTGSGNGITGDDETSEDVSATWDTTFTPPTPGVVPTGLLP